MQPRLMKRVASILLALGPTWGPPPPPRSTLPRSHLYSSSRRFPVVPSLTLGFPHKIPNRASVTPGLPWCSTEISSMASDLHSQGLSCHVLPYTAPGFFAGRRWSDWCSFPNFASLILAPDADGLTICSGGRVPAQGTEELLSIFAMVLSLVQVVRSMSLPLIYSHGAWAWMYPQFSRRGILIRWLLSREKQVPCSSVDVLLCMVMIAVLLRGRSRDHTVHPWYETQQPQRGHRVSTNITWYQHQVRLRPAGGRWPLERGGKLLEGARTSSEEELRQLAVWPSSETEVRSRVAGVDVWWAAEAVGPQQVVGFLHVPCFSCCWFLF
jgi:hypothetical protein